MNSNATLTKALKACVAGDVRDDLMTQQIYSVDASIFEIAPQVVVLPKTQDDLTQTVNVAREFNTPIIPRGGATGIAGGCLGTGIVVDTSKYLTQILECNLEQGYVICQPGVIQDNLNAHLSPFGFRLGADTSTGNRATIGGMCGANAAGAHYLKYGSMIDHVLGVSMVLSSGKTIWLDDQAEMPGLPQVDHAPTFHRSSSGYPLYTLLENPCNLAKLTVGSEGTLGIFSSIKLKLSPQLKHRSLALVSFSSLQACLEVIPEVLKHAPCSLEVLDHHVIEMGRLSPALKGKLAWLDCQASALLIAEFEAGDPPPLFPVQRNLTSLPAQEEVWALRKAGLGLLLSRRSYSRAIAFIEDLSVPPQHLASFVHALKQLVPWDMGIYGHAGDGCLHMRPYVNVTDSREMEKIFTLMPAIVDLVRQFGGALSGEHGDGLVRSWLNPRLFEPDIYAAMVQVKEAFDPLHLMNPGKIVAAKPPQEYLRPSKPVHIPTFLNFEPEGGLHLAADLCNGNGACRKQTGLMCPSFQAFKDERHSTRARAQSLRSILNERVPMSEFTGDGLKDVLDYCLGCKGCKKECPSQVDMAKMKIETLYQYQVKHGYSLKNRLFGNLHTLSAYGSALSPLSNWLGKAFSSLGVPSLLGITTQRSLPHFARKRFTSWWRTHTPSQKGTKKRERVHLFIDTFTEFHSPEIGIAAVNVLEKLGFQVEPIPPMCCGRPFLSVGMLEEAKNQAEKLSTHLAALRSPVVVLEPSCLSAINDDYPSLISSSHRVYTLEEMLPDLTIEQPLFYHPHCHEQALFTKLPFKKIFPQMTLSTAGCCGLAGSFGYETHHYPMSMAIAENSLFPQIRALPSIPVVASGFSCRQQISHGLSQTALHPAQIISNYLLKF